MDCTGNGLTDVAAGLPADFMPVEIDFDNLTHEMLLSESIYAALMGIPDNYKRSEAEGKCTVEARKYKILREFNNNYKQYKMREASKKKLGGLNTTNFSGAPFQLLCGEWEATDNGIKRFEVSPDGKVSSKTACPHPILPIEVLSNIDTETEKLKLAFYKNKNWEYIICERSITANASKIIELANRGIEVNSENAKALVSYIADCMALNENLIPRTKAISRMGWVGRDFMPYDNNIRFDGDKENRYLYDCLNKKGSYPEWVEYTKKLREKPLMRLQMAASFASPIIELVNALPFILHFWGGPLTSGSGKTVGLMVSASIWGNPGLGGLVRTMDSTQNATMNIAGFLRNIPYFGDELQLIKSCWANYDKLVMKACEGADRGRMSFDKMLPTKTWRNAFLFTGEEAIVRKDSGAGVYSRVIEVECKELVVENGNHIVNFISGNYGLAGEVFINALRQEDLKAQYSGLFKEILEECDTNEKQAMAMALVLLGDRIAEKYIYKSGRTLGIDDIKGYLFSKDEIDTAQRAYEWVHNWIAANMARFEKDDNHSEIWGKIDEDYAMINKNILSEHMSKMGIELSAVINKWSDKQLIYRNSQRKNVHQTHVYGIKASYIKFKFDKWEDVDDSELPFG